MHPSSYFGFVFVGIFLTLAGCITGPPFIEPPPASCTEDWVCSEWAACSNGNQTRTCVDQNDCGTADQKPATNPSCETSPISTPAECGNLLCEENETPVSCPLDCTTIEPRPDNDFPVQVNLGTSETVFDYETMNCAELDLPDVDAHAFRDSQNEIVLVSGNAPDNYWMFGKDFNSLKRSCTPVLRSGDKWDITAFNHQEWVASTYTEDGKTIHALVHNEYHDPYATNCNPGVTDPSNTCWWNFISYAKSTDGGKTFTQPANPSHIVAILPTQWTPVVPNARKPDAKPPPQGYMEPSNIVKKDDGYYYVLFNAYPSATVNADNGTCLMRSNNLSDPSSWKIWDGNGFTISRAIPYPTPPSDVSAYKCAYVMPQTMSGSLTYNTYLERYMAVGAGYFLDSQGNQTCGFWFTLSNDLINWGKPKLLRKTVLGWAPCNNPTPAQQTKSIDQEAYPSLIDHDSNDRSFTTADNTAFLYYMSNMDNHAPGGWGLRRNLVRIPLTFTKEEN